MKEELKVEVLYKNTDISPIEHFVQGDWIDLRCAEYGGVFMLKGEYHMIKLGVAMKLPDGYEAIVSPRSSTFKKYGVIQTNSIGVIDGSFCGNNDEWLLPVYATRDTFIPFNERICQFRIFEHQPRINFEPVWQLSDTDRGGFGSTDAKENENKN